MTDEEINMIPDINEKLRSKRYACLYVRRYPRNL